MFGMARSITEMSNEEFNRKRLINGYVCKKRSFTKETLHGNASKPEIRLSKLFFIKKINVVSINNI